MQLVIGQEIRLLIAGGHVATNPALNAGLVIPDIEHCELVAGKHNLLISNPRTRKEYQINTSDDWDSDRLLALIMRGVARSESKWNTLFVQRDYTSTNAKGLVVNPI